MEKVIFSPSTVIYLNDLVFALFEQDYFSYEESAHLYVRNLAFYFEKNIPIYPAKKTPQRLAHFGQFYQTYIPNKQTTWYAVYFKKGNKFLVTHIFNNHCPEAKHFNSD